VEPAARPCDLTVTGTFSTGQKYRPPTQIAVRSAGRHLHEDVLVAGDEAVD